MKPKEAKRLYVMERVLGGNLTEKQAAELLSVSQRTVQRWKRRMKDHGPGGLVHGNRGRKPKHSLSSEGRRLIVYLATNELKGASCEHMVEILGQVHNISISSRTVRRVLRNAGVDNPHSHKIPRKRRRSRTRMPQEGLLVQCDASPFAWLEDRGPELHLHGAIDDATGKILGLHFRPHEDLVGYLHVLKQVVEGHGIPCSLYSDRHTIFVSPKEDKLSIEEELAGRNVPLTRFGEALQELSITHKKARSPQAKGRVERLWGTLQHRLVIEMRMAGISSLEEANAFLPGFISRYNARFAVAPAQPESAFRPAPPPEVLDRIICWKERRKASNGSTISYGGRTYQIVNQKAAVIALKPRSQVEILFHLDGRVDALHEGKLYGLKELAGPLPARQRPTKKSPANQTTYKPAENHPWRRPMPAPVKKDPLDRYFAQVEPLHLAGLR